MSNGGIAGGDMAGGGGGDFIRVPRFILEDSPQLAKKLKGFEDAQERANEALALVGEAEAIPRLRAQVEQELNEAEEAHAHTRAECERLISEASEAARSKVEGADVTAKELVRQAEAKLAQAEASRLGAKTLENANKHDMEILVARKSEYDHKDEALQQRADALAKQEQELTGEKTRIAELRDLISKAL
jgi:hypothetical protein